MAKSGRENAMRTRYLHLWSVGNHWIKGGNVQRQPSWATIDAYVQRNLKKVLGVVKEVIFLMIPNI